jgi:hypothetical protein
MEISGQLQAPVALTPGKEPPVPIGDEAGWAPEPVWTLRRREKYCTARNQTRAVQNVGHYNMHHQFKRCMCIFINAEETFLLVSWSGVRPSPLGTSATIWPIVPSPDDI